MPQNYPNILAVDDEPSVIKSLQMVFEKGYRIHPAASAEEALSVMDRENIRIVILDLGLPDMNGLELLPRIKEMNPALEVIVLTADDKLKSGIEAMKRGACDYLVKPFEVEEITLSVKNAMAKSRLSKAVSAPRLTEPEKYRRIIGESKAIKDVLHMADTLAGNDATVLICGESGTGKELIAHRIHNKSARKEHPFVPVNCGAIPSELLESELFGHEKGAFTGAAHSKPGKFEIAQGGTIFLDEISTLPLAQQAKLLRVLQEKTIERVGGTQNIPVDARIIAATNLDLKTMVKQKKFREDLYYRLNVIQLKIPPLRERKEDIPLLVNHFLDIYNREYQREIKGIPKELMSYLRKYEWNGNVRELENVIQRLVILSTSQELDVNAFPAEILMSGFSALKHRGKKGLTLEKALACFEQQYIRNALIKAKRNKTGAAKFLGIHRNTLINRMATLKMKR